MLVSPDNILPSQDFLKPQTLTFILECIENGDLDSLPPSPIVREDDDGNLIAIDGHNLIAVKYVRKEDIDVHVATSSSDGIPEMSEADIKRNKDLLDKFDTVLAERARIVASGINNFGDLVSRYESTLGQ